MRILYVQPGPGIGGAKISLASLLGSKPPEQLCQVALSSPPDLEYVRTVGGFTEKIHHLYLPTWQKKQSAGLRKQLLFAISRLIRGGYLVPTARLASIIVKEHIDIVHTNSSVCPVGAFAAFLTRRPHIWHVREPLERDGGFLLAPGGRLAACLFKYLSAAIVCNSQYTAGFFRQYGMQPRVIYNGIRLEEFRNSQERGQLLRDQLNLRRRDPVVGMVGSLGAQWKEHGLFLHAAAVVHNNYPTCQFVVFGGLSDLDANLYTKSLRELAARLQITPDLTWAGFENDIPALMHSLDILVHPTSQEGSGRVIMEAMSAGKPVVSVRSGGVQELIQDNETGFLVPPKEPQTLANGIEKLLEDPTRRHQMGEAARVYAWQHFSLDKTVESIQSLYREISSARAMR